MRFTPTALAGAWLVDLDAHPDERGFFARTFCAREFEDHGLPTELPQANLSRNRRAGTLRGMHVNADWHAEAKLVRCSRGAIHDVIVDLRRDSPTYLDHVAVDLDAERCNALFVPAAFAHGFITLVDDTDVEYGMSAIFAPTAARGFRWNDPAFGISWPVQPVVISARDASYPDFDRAILEH